MPVNLTYQTFERVPVPRPVDRIDYVARACAGRTVLDIGCLDETALIKRDTEHWLHGRIAGTAKTVIGIDNSAALSDEGLQTAPNARIHKSNGINPDAPYLRGAGIDMIVAGEFIEHIENPLDFLRGLKHDFPGRQFIMTTPNGTALANGLLGLLGREAQHHDHLMTSTYKTLNTLCLRAGFADWTIIPYRCNATELILHSSGVKRAAFTLGQGAIRLAERLFPLRSFGFIAHATL